MRRGSLLFLILLSSLTFLLTACGTTTSSATGTEKKPLISHTKNIIRATPTPLTTPTTVPVAVDEPLLLNIPSINVNSPIEPVGITDSGDLATPEKSPWTDAGWYSGGITPGARGSAVIDGHLDRPGGGPATFWLLRDIKVGDSVMVTMASGKTLTFHVTHTALYPPQNAPLQGIFGDTGGNYLNLITCAGDWIPSQGQTTLRMVVYTTLG